jgi:hypothetical protein
MKRSSSGHAALMRGVEDRLMENTRSQAEDLLEVARVLLLVQGAILVATTIEALVFGGVFAGAAGSPAFMSGAAAALILTARARLRGDRRWTRRIVYGIEIMTLAFLAIDAVLAIALTRALPPMVALVTQLVLPMSVIALLRRSARARSPRMPSNANRLLEGV